MPARGDELADEGRFRGLLVEMEGLRIEFARKAGDLLARHEMRAACAARAGGEVFEVELDLIVSHSRLLGEALDLSPNDRGEWREIVLDNVENDLVVDALIGVTQLVSYCSDTPPIHCRMAGFEIIRQMPRGLRNDLKRSLNGVLQRPGSREHLEAYAARSLASTLDSG